MLKKFPLLVLSILILALLSIPLYADYLVTKSLHLLFVISWFAGLFYLPRIFVNLAQESHPAAVERLLLMADKLYRFMTILAIPAIGFGLWLYIGPLFGFPFPDFHLSGWMHAKMLLVLILIGYHHGCYRILVKFRQQKNQRSHVFYRWYNEIPVLVLTVVILLVILKPF